MLDIDGLTVELGGREVLHSVGLSVKPGQMRGFVGRNGAGKTTTMRAVMGLVAVRGGTIRWDGRITDTDVVRRQFGYMPEERGLYQKQTAREQLTYFAELAGVRHSQAGRVVDAVLEELGLLDQANKKVEQLSLGNQQRVQICAALMGDPRLLILDEPFSGLDPSAVTSLAGALRGRANDHGTAILYSSHQLELVETYCDTVTVLDDGSVRYDGEVASFSDGTHGYVLRTREEEYDWLARLPGVCVESIEDGRAHFRTGTQEQVNQVVATAATVATVAELSPRRVKLSEFFPAGDRSDT